MKLKPCAACRQSEMLTEISNTVEDGIQQLSEPQTAALAIAEAPSEGGPDVSRAFGVLAGITNVKLAAETIIDEGNRFDCPAPESGCPRASYVLDAYTELLYKTADEIDEAGGM